MVLDYLTVLSQIQVFKLNLYWNFNLNTSKSPSEISVRGEYKLVLKNALIEPTTYK